MGNGTVVMDPAERYPPQEPLSPRGQAHAHELLTLGAGLTGREISYGSHPGQTLTLFEPAEANGIVLVFFHGGGWTNGYKEWMYFMAPGFMARGVTFASATYRLAPDNVFPAGFHDCADAVACVHELTRSLEDFAMFVGGHSAGGHYAALLAVTDDWQASRGLPRDVLTGSLPISGTYRFGEGSGLKVRPRFLGPDAQAETLAAPIHRIAGSHVPPFLLSYGGEDFPHLVAQAGEMESRLKAAGIPVQVEILDGVDHFDAGVAAGDPAKPWMDGAVSWMATWQHRKTGSARGG